MSEKDATVMAALLANVPWKVRVLLLATVFFGPGLLGAIFFASLWAGWLPSPITKNTEILAQNQQLILQIKRTLDENVIAMKAEVGDSQELTTQMIRLQLSTCINVAKDEAARGRCENYWRKER